MSSEGSGDDPMPTRVGDVVIRTGTTSASGTRCGASQPTCSRRLVPGVRFDRARPSGSAEAGHDDRSRAANVFVVEQDAVNWTKICA